MKLQLVGIVGVLIIACASAAAAQQAPEKVNYPKWDAATTIGFVVPAGREFGGSGIYPNNDPAWTWNADIGRFLTTHIKADATVMTTTSRYFYDGAFAPISGQPTNFVNRRVRPTAVSTGITYQFFENAFMHPYVTGGIRLNVLQEVRETSTFPSWVPTEGGKRTSVEVRPFGSIGVKSYFNERIFLKSELTLAADQHGISHGTARVGIGFDF